VELREQPRAVSAPRPETRPRGLTGRAGRHFAGRPVVAFIFTALVGFALVAALAVLAGWLLITYALPAYGIGRRDEHVNVWLAAHRSGLRTEVSLWLSRVGDIDFIPAAVGLTALIAAVRRRWWVAAFVVAAAGLEALLYRVVVLGIHRDRPEVPRLDDLPANHSFYSGHTAASVAAYCGIALVVTRRLRSTAARAVVWAVAVVIPVLVALARLYRGEHHPTDVAAGALVGIGMLLVAGAAVRAARTAQGSSITWPS
jgi:membrane-associated phospholipid phosphatase